jgi:hypothetical protein
MDNQKIAKELIKLAAIMEKDWSPLDSMTKQRAVRYVNKLMDPYTKGFFRDTSWQHVHAIFRALEKDGIETILESTRYMQDQYSQSPNAKEWKFTIEFENQRGRTNTLYGVIVDSGAASISDPLAIYDVVAYVS